MPLDPVASIASMVQGAPGAYCILAGSGVSHAAKVKTGWDIALELVRRVAVLEGEAVPDDPVQWYRDKHGNDIDYSQLVGDLGISPGDRQALLAGYFEPRPDDLTTGTRQPTSAHQAIARLVADGYVKVIVTTNFDRLFETALSAAGVAPKVVASVNDLDRISALHMYGCVVVKVHGDMLNPDLRNTIDELESYEPRMDSFLDRIFGDYGVIVAGWSARWDPALRAALLRNRSEFSTVWLEPHDVAPEAAEIIDAREAVTLSLDSDSFFTDLLGKVESLAALDPGRPAASSADDRDRELEEARALVVELQALVERLQAELAAGSSTSAADVAATFSSLLTAIPAGGVAGAVAARAAAERLRRADVPAPGADVLGGADGDELATLKRLIPDPRGRIAVDEVVMAAVERAITATSGESFQMDGGVSNESYLERIRNYDAAVLPLVRLLATLAFYGDTEDHWAVVVRAIDRLINRPLATSGKVVLLEAQRYPAVLALVAVGVASLARGRVRPFADVLARVDVEDDRNELPMPYLINSGILTRDILRGTSTYERRHTPGSDHVRDVLRPVFDALEPSDERYDGYFDDTEYLLGLVTAAGTDGRWGPVGRFGWRRRYPERGAVDGAIERHADELLGVGLFGGDAEQLDRTRADYASVIREISSGMH